MYKNIKRLTACLLFGIVLVGCGKFFRYILIDDTASYTRVMFHEMYAQENIDVLFVGSSHCYRSFIPEIIDRELEVTAFNAGTSSQDLDGSYMIIKEAARYNDIKHIYLELYYNIAFHPAYKARTELTQTYIIADYLRPSWDKLQYLLAASSKVHYPNSFILARRNWPKFFDDEYVKNLILMKGSDAYKNYDYTYITRETEWYAGKGYVANNVSIEDWNYFSANGWSAANFEDLTEDWLESLKDIIAFCDQEGISLTLISAPIPNYLLAGIGNYDEYVKFVKGMIEGENVNYYDFNLCKEEFFPNKSSLFKDADHLNCYGAEVFSRLFSDFINREISEEELFYSSYNEKLGNLEPTVFGISYHDDKNENNELIRNCKIVSTGTDNLEYEIDIAPTGGETRRIQEFSGNSFFAIAPEEHGMITITYRLGDSANEIWETKISY